MAEKEIKLDLEEENFDNEDNVEEYLNIIEAELDVYPMGAMIVNQECTIEYANDFLCAIFKYDREELMDSNVNILLPEEYRPKHNELMSTFFKEDQFSTGFDRVLAGQDKLDGGLQLDINLTLRKIEVGGTVHKFAVAYVREVEDESVDAAWVVMPTSNFYIAWITVMIFFILLILVYLPYRLTFSSGNNQWIDVLIDVAFYMDILISFNLAFKDERDRLVTRRWDIVLNYVTGWLFLDVVASFPYDVLTYFISDSNFSFKTLNMLRFIRIFRLIKITKTIKGNQFTKLLLKNYYGRELVSRLRNNLGVYEIFKMICILLLLAHYFAVVWISIEESNLSNPNIWVYKSNMGYDQTLKTDKESLYSVMMYELISAAMGYNRLEVYNEKEKVFSLFWMIVGIAFFSYVIGNVSSYVSQMNLKDLEYNSKMKIIDNLSYDNNLSDDLIKLMTDSVNQSRDKFESNSIDELKPYLSKDVFNQLQKELFTSFIARFTLLQKFSMETIAVIKEHASLKTDSNVYKINSLATDLYFITKGQVQLFDGYMNMAGEYEVNEVLGHEEFVEYMAKRLQALEDEDKNTKKKEGSADPVEDKSVKHKHYAIAKEDTEYLCLAYSVLEELVNLDNSISYKIGEHVKNQQTHLTLADKAASENFLKAFDSADKAGLIYVSKEDIVFRSNKTFNSTFDEKDIADKDIKNVFLGPDRKPVSNAESLKKGLAYLVTKGDEVAVELEVEKKSIVLDRNKNSKKLEATVVWITNEGKLDVDNINIKIR